MNIDRTFSWPVPKGTLTGHLSRPLDTRTLIVICHAGPPFPAAVAAGLAGRGHALLACDLVLGSEAHRHDPQLNPPLLADRLLTVLDRLHRDDDLDGLRVGLLGAGGASAAAVRAAAQRDVDVAAVVVHGGLIDSAGLQYLEALTAPLLVLVDHADELAAAAAARAFVHIHGVREIHRVEKHAAAPDAAAWFSLWLR